MERKKAVIDLSDGGPLNMAGWCPICGRKLDAEHRCSQHGVMNRVLPHDPLAAAAKHCDSVGIVNLEAA